MLKILSGFLFKHLPREEFLFPLWIMYCFLFNLIFSPVLDSKGKEHHYLSHSLGHHYYADDFISALSNKVLVNVADQKKQKLHWQKIIMETYMREYIYDSQGTYYVARASKILFYNYRNRWDEEDGVPIRTSYDVSEDDLYSGNHTESCVSWLRTQRSGHAVGTVYSSRADSTCQ